MKVEKIKQLLKLKYEDVNYDNFIETYYDEAIRDISLIIDQPVILQETHLTEYIQKIENQDYFKRLPIFGFKEVVSVEYRRNGTSEYELIDNWFFENSNGKPYLVLMNFKSGFYRFTFEQGYEEDDLPDDIKRIIVEYIYIRMLEMGVLSNDAILNVITSAITTSNIIPTTSTYKDMRAIWEQQLQKYIIFV